MPVSNSYDLSAIHDNEANEISAIAEKNPAIDADLLIIEDSAAANAKKRVQIANLPRITEVLCDSVYASANDDHTTNNTWEDVNSMSISLSPTVTCRLVCDFTVVYVPISADWQQSNFKFLLDGATSSESWTSWTKGAAADTALTRSHHFHTVFEAVAAGAHTVKVQWITYNDMNCRIQDRRLTVMSIEA